MIQRYSARFLILGAMLAGAGALAFFAPPAFSAPVVELREQIADRNQKIQELEAEIAQFQNELNEVAEERQTLQSAVRTLDISRNKLATNIRVTENRIDSTDLQIQELQIEIADKERRIEQGADALGETIRRMDAAEQRTLVEALLTHSSLSQFWAELASLAQFQKVIRQEIEDLTKLKQALAQQKSELEGKRTRLVDLKQELAGQKRALDATRREQNQLLQQTKNEEARYQELIAEKEAAHEQFEQELLRLSRELEFQLDPDTIPPVGQGILRWPVDDVFITQYFGNTEFATQNPQVYSGRGHNGVDFRASPGTKIRAALAGTVIGTGNTDLQSGCFSFGKWVMIEHSNGLSTLYAHLSVIDASVGERVDTGEVIGYSGNTGYSTGPHLHFGVYATSGTRIVKLGDVKSRTNCSDVRVPVADINAYLNPLSYL